MSLMFKTKIEINMAWRTPYLRGQQEEEKLTEEGYKGTKKYKKKLFKMV